MINIDSYLHVIMIAENVVPLVGLTNIQKINNNSSLNDDDKRKAKIEYLNKQLDKYDGDDKKKLQCFCTNDLRMQPDDNLNKCKVGSILMTQLGHAVSYGDLAIIEWLLSKGVDVNSDIASGWGNVRCGIRALHIAARTRNPSVVEFLVKNNADVNRRTFSSYYTNIYTGCCNAGSTALHETIRYGNVETFKKLLATTEIGGQSLAQAYEFTKKILCLLQEEPDYIRRLRLDLSQILDKQFMNSFLTTNQDLLNDPNYNKELHGYIGLMNVQEGIKKILAYIENIENSVFILFGVKRGVDKSEFGILSFDIFKNVASFLFSQDSFINHRIKVTEQKINDKKLSTPFFSLMAKKLNSSVIDSTLFNKYIEDHVGNKRTAGALVLRR